MKITEITIKNYKSIKQLSVKLNVGLNAFIGENNTGKSNIFEAINWLLGPAYPTFNSTKKSDHYLGDENNKIFIKLQLDNGYVFELDESKAKYNFSISHNGQWQRDISSLREKHCCAYIGNERTIVDYLPSDRWSLLGRLLQDINKKFLEEKIQDSGKEIKKSEKLKKDLDQIRDNLLFSVEDAEGRKIMKNFIDVIKKESAEQLNKNVDDFEVNLNLYDPWDFYRTLQIIVNEKDIGLKFQASQLGMGAQASITVAILKAYSEIKLGGENPIFIDEPELYLHPQAQRNFYRILRKLAESGTQVFYTTHSPDFLSAGHFDEIFIVRKITGSGTKLYFGDVSEFIADLQARTSTQTDKDTLLEHYRNACDETGDSQKANEAFFAKKIILVEGSSESLSLPYFFGLLDFDYIKEGITIVRCGSKNEVDRFYRLYSEFGIPCYVIFDGDKQLQGTSNEQKNIKVNKALFQLFGDTTAGDYPEGQAKDAYIGFEQEFENNLGFTAPRDSKGLDLYLKIKERIKNKQDVPSWVKDVVDKVSALKQEDVKSVLINNQDQEEEIVTDYEGENEDTIPF